MSYPKTKIYSDGSHFIGVLHEEHPERSRKRTVVPDEKKEAFEIAYNENKTKKKKEQTESVVREMKKHFGNETEAREYVLQNTLRKIKNIIARRKRLWRKVNMQEWHYFATFTYDDKKHTEDNFRRSLSNCLKHLSSRKGWKYIGVWERSPEKQRLHFHCLLCIPNGAEIGELIEKNDYDTISQRRQTTYQNTHFNERYGRTDFKPIRKEEIGNVVGYLIKYMEKTGEKIVYSKNLPQYIISDVMEDDIACFYGIESRKVVLFDNFNCWNEGEYIGQVSPEVIAKMPKSN